MARVCRHRRPIAGISGTGPSRLRCFCRKEAFPMADQKPIALVTGGSSGIGYELAREFATNGFDVIIVAHRQGRLIEAQQSLRSATGARIEAISADLSEPEGVRRLHEQASSIGPIDTLVLNAGHGAYGEFATDTSLEDELDLIALKIG